MTQISTQKQRNKRTTMKMKTSLTKNYDIVQVILNSVGFEKFRYKDLNNTSNTSNSKMLGKILKLVDSRVLEKQKMNNKVGTYTNCYYFTDSAIEFIKNHHYFEIEGIKNE